MRSSARRAALLAALAGLAGVPVAAAQEPVAPAGGRAGGEGISLEATTSRRGYVGAVATALPGTKVSVYEEVRGRQVLRASPMTASASASPAWPRLVAWRCDRRRRALVAVGRAPDGTVSSARATVTTPGCADRFTARVTGRVRAATAARVLVRDTFGVGAARVRACLEVSTRSDCRSAYLRRGVRAATLTLRAPRAGRGRLVVTTTGQRLVQDVQVLERRGRLRVLAAGDSEIQILDGLLRARLKPLRADVIFDDHISTSIGRPSLLDWPRHAKATAASIRPDVTVMFLGANDGWPLRATSGRIVGCCSRAWSHELARRARGMMRSYLRGGRGRVYWMLLPPPRKPAFARVFRAVNRGYEEAAKAFPDSVRLVDLRRTFPDPARGRQKDGVHLSVGSDRTLARLLERLMRQDGLL